MAIEKSIFGKLDDGREVELFALTNTNGIKAKLISFGATLISLQTPDKNGEFNDIVLGYDDVAGYTAGACYFGCTVGRFANRIAKGRFTLEGVEYTLATNDGENHLHGGMAGFDKMLWQGEQFESAEGIGIIFEYQSPDGQEGYPGNLDIKVTYTLTDANELKIAYEAKTDKKTIVNLTNHSYYNLAGAGSGDILSHELMINADGFTPVDETLIPVGRVDPVRDSDLDFTKACAIGARIGNVHGGYDHNFVLNKTRQGELSLAAKVIEPKNGRVMEISTTEPAIQFYSGNFLDGVKGRDGAVYNIHEGFCLETQHYPDSPNQPAFPSVVLEPSDVYKHLTIHKFSTE